MSTIIGRNPARKGSSLNSSSEDTFHCDSQDVPMGNINKTTHVDVQYGRDGIQHAVTNPKSKEHGKTISATHLVDQDFSFP